MNELIKLWVSVTKRKEIEEFESDVQKLYDYTMNLQKENQQLKLINKEYERLDNGESRGCTITRVDEYDIYDLIKCKDNWNKLKEWVNKHYDYYMNNGDYIGGRLCFTDMKDKMQELEQESDSNDSN